ncbi:MAG: hypothetical protein JO112_09990, partial [Planctomycetes bacterium]|nr:hypothetical protein [Planctomycetota bacterium]
MFPFSRPGNRSTSRTRKSRSDSRTHLVVEELEVRCLMSNAPLGQALAQPVLSPATIDNPSIYGYTPAQVRHAYGFDQLPLDGSGQTIAIVEAYDDPTIAADLHAFDQTFGLPDPNLTRVNQNGGTQYPSNNALWGQEAALDVEWAHAIAPGANILLVEANSESTTDLMAAVDYARSQPGVSAVSMSWAVGEFPSETSLDRHFTTPGGHGGVTFIGAAGDEGAGAEWPAASPNVVAVGGTSLSVDGSGNYQGETGWASGSGGISSYEAKPGYQSGLTPGGTRSVPDVAYDSNPATGFAVYDTDMNYTGDPWFALAGTSAAAPQWAGLVALANQGRAQHGLGALDGTSQTLPLLYSAPSSAFHDVTSGGNGNVATPGYDLITGRGSPAANVLIPYLVGAAVSAATPVQSPVSSQAPVNVSQPPVQTVHNPGITNSQPVGTSTTIISSVSLGANSTVFGIGADHGLYRRDPSGWTKLSNGQQFVQISAGTDEQGNADVYGVTSDGALYKYDVTHGLYMVDNPGQIQAVNATEDNWAIAVTTDGSIYSYNGLAYGQGARFIVEGAGFAQAVSATNDAAGRLIIFVVTPQHTLVRIDQNFNLATLSGSESISQISAGQDGLGNADAYAVTADGALYKFDSLYGFFQVDGSGQIQQVNAAQDDWAVAVGTAGNVFTYNGKGQGYGQRFQVESAGAAAAVSADTESDGRLKIFYMSPS